MTITTREQQTSQSVLSGERAIDNTTHHENLIVDGLLKRTLQTLLQITNSEGQMRARQLREGAGLTLSETAQVLQYLQRLGILQEEIGGQRVVDRVLAMEYLSIVAPEEGHTKDAPEPQHSFTREHIAWGCFLNSLGKLTPTRVVRPSHWTSAMAEALGLVTLGAPNDPLFTRTRADLLCTLVSKMSEQERSSSFDWAQLQLQQKQGTIPQHEALSS